MEIAILCYPGAQTTCVHGLTDLFMYADCFARTHAARIHPATPRPAGPGDEPFVRITHCRVAPDDTEIECVFESCPGSDGKFALVVVPAYQLGRPEPNHSPQTAAWVSRLHAEGVPIATVCGGVFLLAESGLLAGRRITTHWKFAAELRRRFPDLLVDVERRLGRTVMISTARFMLVDPPGREQRFYDEFAPPLQHGDRAVLAIQRWLQANASATSTVEALAERAGLGARTFLRRFVKATGMKPSDYQQRLRIARSREWLEFTRDTVDQVAAAAGYEDTSGFRRTFKRVIGLSPTEYRRRYQRQGTSGQPQADLRFGS